jgi:hypothetical protein
MGGRKSACQTLAEEDATHSQDQMWQGASITEP